MITPVWKTLGNLKKKSRFSESSKFFAEIVPLNTWLQDSEDQLKLFSSNLKNDFLETLKFFFF